LLRNGDKEKGVGKENALEKVIGIPTTSIVPNTLILLMIIC
jgi:hypothetical protein